MNGILAGFGGHELIQTVEDYIGEDLVGFRMEKTANQIDEGTVFDGH